VVAEENEEKVAADLQTEATAEESNVSPDAESSEAAASSSTPENAADDDDDDGDGEGSGDAGDAGDSPAQVVAGPAGALMQGDWQAIWSAPHSAYYFFNSRTQETTWANPLGTGGDAGSSAQGTAGYDAQAAALAQGIDPALAHLDPSLGAGPSNPAAYSYSAKFNARTGAFTKPEGRDPTHVSEFERMKRMSEFYFDYNAWQTDLEQQNAEEAEAGGKRKKKPSKADLEMFKERKKQKKIAKTAWLRT